MVLQILPGTTCSPRACGKEEAGEPSPRPSNINQHATRTPSSHDAPLSWALGKWDWASAFSGLVQRVRGSWLSGAWGAGSEWALQGLLAGRGWDLEASCLSKRAVGKAALWRASAGTPRL